MARCLQLAENGRGTTYPNPMVGSVIVRDQKIISEGWHHSPGRRHAEAEAIYKCDPSQLQGATLYVNLEPCNHVGKTEACAPLIVAAGIKKVVVGSGDTNDKVNGSGITHLEKHGIEVITGVLEAECRELNKRFFRFHEQKRPYITLKWAETKNGYVAPLTKKELRPVWISNAYARQHTHFLRSQEQAILVGHKTWTQDNPRLSAYRWNENNPIIVVLGGVEPRDATTASLIPEQSNDKEIIWLSSDVHQGPRAVADKLHALDIQSVLIEGGPQTLQRFIDANLWDECYRYQSQDLWTEGLSGPRINVPLNPIANFEDNVLYHAKNQT
jgi:diaminohydroxyphosphoribosylaminopyrimidine deaminase/5-amino-6-(5-phosphoribosylamino)uracil reductase